MEKFSIGDLVSLKNHPYNIASNSKIGAMASLTPPIMVITEILNSSKYNPDSEEQELIPNQVLCTFFNSKNSSFEKFWFKSNEIFHIHDNTNDYEQLNIETNFDIIDFEIRENKDLTSIKKEFKHNLVILLTADEELGKQKISWFKNKEEDNYKTEAFLEFLPPVMTVVDVVENSNYLKERRDSKDGSLKKDSSKYLLKCKWFNSIKQTFSEEFIPYKIIQKVNFSNDTLKVIEAAINEKTVFSINSNEKEIKINSKKLKKLVIFKNIIIFNHSVKVLFKDIFSNKTSTEKISKLDITSLECGLEDFVEKKYPDYTLSSYPKRDSLTWSKNKFYRIKYVDRNGRNTERYITNTELKTFDTDEEENVKFIVANCLLRNGEIRHFKLNNINETFEMNDDFGTFIKK